MVGISTGQASRVDAYLLTDTAQNEGTHENRSATVLPRVHAPDESGVAAPVVPSTPADAACCEAATMSPRGEPRGRRNRTACGSAQVRRRRRWHSAEKIASVRPGNSRSQSVSIFFTGARCRFCCEPQSVHGMIGKRARARVARDVALRHVGQRPDHDVAAVVRDAASAASPSGLPAEEHVQEQRLDDVVAMVAERDLGRRQFAGAQRYSAPRRSREHSRTGRLALGDHALDDASRCPARSMWNGTPSAAQVVGQHLARESPAASGRG